MLAAPDERLVLETRRHGIVLVAAFARILAVAGCGVLLLTLGWPYSVLGTGLLLLAAAAGVASVWRWERTLVVLTDEKLFVVRGTLRRRAAAVRLSRVHTIELEQTLLGRLLGYGTLVAGELEIAFVPAPRELCALVERVAA